MSDVRFPMKMVTQRTGLSAHVVRVWERRYGVVSPDRAGSNHRLYSEEDVHRLELMARLTRGGHSIGQISELDISALEALAAELPNEPVVEKSENSSDRTVHEFFDEAWLAVEKLDSQRLQELFEEASTELGASVMIEQMLVPLIGIIGDRWDSGSITVAQERAASTVIQEALLLAGRPHSETSGAPELIVVTPSGQVHELGAALVVCLARRRGWRVTYLGASIPAEEIAHAAKLRKAHAVALSLVYPADDAGLPDELERLRKLLPTDCKLLAGGRAADGYGSALKKIRAQRFGSLTELKAWFDAEREARQLT